MSGFPNRIRQSGSARLPRVPDVSPTVRRRRLTAELRRLRESQGKTIDDVAVAIGMSKTTLSRIENGQSGIKIPILRALLKEYGVNDEAAAQLERLSREASQRGWWQVTGPTDPFKTLVGLEAEAKWINYFSNTFIIGLLQTEAYARALLEAIDFDATEQEIDLAVNLRLRRQERLNDLNLGVILSEEGLLRPVGGVAVMIAQIERLLEVSADRGIDIQILATQAGAHVGLAGNFEIVGLDFTGPEAVYVEGARWDACIEDPHQLIVYTRSFEKLRALALGPGDSRARLHQIAKDYAS
jgi:transcriptional regulator with XRE-family HTH domain